jgi:hypothetical protein
MSFWTGTHWEEPERSAPKPKARPSRLRHAAEAVAEGSLIALLVVGLIAGTAFAGNRTSSVWVDELAGARSAGLAYGSPFTVGYETSAQKPWAQARCYPDSSTDYRQTYGDGWVWAENFSVYPGGPMPQAFELTDPIAENWRGGGADCVVRLVKYSSDYSRYTVLATSSFTVVP